MKKCMRPLFKGQTYLYLPNFTKKKYIYLDRIQLFIQLYFIRRRLPLLFNFLTIREKGVDIPVTFLAIYQCR